MEVSVDFVFALHLVLCPSHVVYLWSWTSSACIAGENREINNIKHRLAIRRYRIDVVTRHNLNDKGSYLWWTCIFEARTE